MSGPVWTRSPNQEVTCDKCLRQVETSYNEGVVIDGAFVPRRILCGECYDANIHLIGKAPTGGMPAKP